MTKTCKICGRQKEFGRVGKTECCGTCMPAVIEANAKSIRSFVDSFLESKDASEKRT